ncbi:Complex 1 LYR protein [Rutstroemia sp. NJR-2017a BBW]|nr:Complex 1 LYR protein [Rutstroemia sp. NJR-2017a BBW]
MARYSGLQREVLGLYRKCLRESRKKPVVSNAQWNGGAAVDLFVKEARKHFEAYARTEFQKSIKLDKKDFGAIEYLLRKGQRQVEMYSSPGIKDIR